MCLFHILSCLLVYHKSVSQISVWAGFYYSQFLIICITHRHASRQKGCHYTLLCSPSVKLIIIASSVLLEHPCCTQKLFFWLKPLLMLFMRHAPPHHPPTFTVTACSPSQQMQGPVRSKPGDFDSSCTAVKSSRLPDIIGFCVLWHNVGLFFLNVTLF